MMKPIQLETIGRKFRVSHPYRCSVCGYHINIKAGFVTDLASVPRVFRWIFSVTGSYTGAAIIHDWLYYSGKISRDKSDLLFLCAMERAKVGFVTRWCLYSAVRLGGWVAWNDHRKREV